MSIAFDFRQEMSGPWEVAQGYVVEQFERLYAGLAVIQPLLSLSSLPASSVLVTNTTGVPSFSTTLPIPLAIGAGTSGLSRANGSQILPNAYATQAVSAPTANINQLAHSFFVNTAVDIPGSSSQVFEAYNYYSGTGTTTVVICNLGNAEHGGTGTITNMRAQQGGTTISSTGGGGDSVCFFAAASGRVFGGTGTFTNAIAFDVSSMGTGYTNHYALYSADATAGIFLTSDTAVKSSTNTWQVSSDARVKTDVRPFTDGLDLVLQLHPVHYTYNGLGDTKAGDQGVGLIAQEAQAVAPSLIKTRQARSDGQTYLTLDSGDLTWVYANALQELAARVRALETR